MPYRPTGRPPGRPRKNRVAVIPQEQQHEPQNSATLPEQEEQPEADIGQPKALKRAHKGFRRAGVDPRDELYRPPRFGPRRQQREVGRRPILHPHVIAKT